MKYIFLLSGDYTDLGAEEVVSLLGVKQFKLKNRLMILELNDESLLDKMSKRLALTKNIYRFLFECKLDDLIKSMGEFGWNSVYKENFCVRKFDIDWNSRNGIIKKSANNKSNAKSDNSKFSEKNLAGLIWRNLKNPKVSLKNPKTEINMFFLEGRVYCGLLVKKIIYDFNLRKAHKRPFPHPSSLHPKVARALVNLSEIKENQSMLDPFCGTGGLLIEAGLMNIKSIGYDISRIISDGCKKNLEYFQIKNFKIFNANALKILHKFDCVVTDLPYGLNSNVIVENKKSDGKSRRLNLKIQKKNFYGDLEKFYLSFLKNLRKIMTGKAVIIFPSYVDYKKLLKDSNFKMEKEFSIYVHRSLTRKIVKIR